MFPHDPFGFCQVPLNTYFPEYTGGTDANKGANYILLQFVQLNRRPLSLYPKLFPPLLTPCHQQLTHFPVV